MTRRTPLLLLAARVTRREALTWLSPRLKRTMARLVSR